MSSPIRLICGFSFCFSCPEKDGYVSWQDVWIIFRHKPYILGQTWMYQQHSFLSTVSVWKWGTTHQKERSRLIERQVGCFYVWQTLVFNWERHLPSREGLSIRTWQFMYIQYNHMRIYIYIHIITGYIMIYIYIYIYGRRKVFGCTSTISTWYIT